jgi:hypothetical protein
MGWSGGNVNGVIAGPALRCNPRAMQRSGLGKFVGRRRSGSSRRAPYGAWSHCNLSSSLRSALWHRPWTRTMTHSGIPPAGGCCRELLCIPLALSRFPPPFPALFTVEALNPKGVSANVGASPHFVTHCSGCSWSPSDPLNLRGAS